LTLLVILLYFIASVFIVLGFMMLFVYRRTRHPALLLLSFVYSGSGLVAGYSMQWWPLLAGFVVAWLLKLAGYDVDGPGRRRAQSPQSPPSSSSDPPRDSP
jgi:hypothetical protein